MLSKTISKISGRKSCRMMTIVMIVVVLLINGTPFITAFPPTQRILGSHNQQEAPSSQDHHHQFRLKDILFLSEGDQALHGRPQGNRSDKIHSKRVVKRISIHDPTGAQTGIGPSKSHAIYQQSLSTLFGPVKVKIKHKKSPTIKTSGTKKIITVKSLPDQEDPATVLALAKMTNNAYFDINDTTSHWSDIPGFNVTDQFGWDAHGIRGYIYESTHRDGQDTENDPPILVIVIKGTSLSVPLLSGPTAKADKLNDNMMFSCCCARTSWGVSWSQVCNCPLSSSQCSMTCLLQESHFEDSYYNMAQAIYEATRAFYPESEDIWMAGHSLGGALASLVAMTNDLAAFTYEAPGELLYAQRIGLLPQDMGRLDEYLRNLHIFHFGNLNDPIFMGQCYGLSSSCYWFNYVLESKCHAGWECAYTSKNSHHFSELHTGTDDDIEAEMIQSHSISYVIKNYIEGAPVPTCSFVGGDCLPNECSYWNFTRSA